MARKQLIKGANAARVEARISRVPVDLSSAPSIFGALKAMEAEAAVLAAPPAAKFPFEPKAKSPAKPKAKSPVKTVAKAVAKRTVKPATKIEAKVEAKVAVPQSAERPIEPPPRPKSGRLSPSDFTAVEREAILRCCKDYRNHLPTYLLAVQKEVKIIDSVIEKCGGEAPDYPA
jgi:hypothetical protein